MSYYAAKWVPMPYAETVRYAFGAIPAGGATGTSHPCPAGYRASSCGPCIPVGQRDNPDPTCGPPGAQPTSTVAERYGDQSSSDTSDASSVDPSADPSADVSAPDYGSSGGGGGGGGSSSYYDTSAVDGGGGGASLVAVGLGVGVVALIGYWFYERIS